MMNGAHIDLDLTGKEMVSISMLSRIGAAFLAEDADYIAEIVSVIGKMDGFEREAINGMDKLDDAVHKAAAMLETQANRTVWS